MAKTRELAKAIASEGHVRIDGRPVARAHAPVRIGDVLSLPLHGRVRIFRVEALPKRRGPADEARMLYSDLSPEPSPDVDGRAPARLGARGQSGE